MLYQPRLTRAVFSQSLAADVAIVGGGFSGALLAINLWRHGGGRVLLIERGPRAGCGVAYSARAPEHLLNVRAGNMSAFPDDPGHFVRWLAARGAGEASDFVPRATYGAYLAELLRDAETQGGVTVLRDTVIDVIPAGEGVVLALAQGAAIVAGRAVLALGNLPPHAPPGIDPAALGPAYIADPWEGDPAAGLETEDSVLLLGTGLTAIDAVMTLDAAGFTGRIVALSRRGLVPRAHGPAGAVPAHAEALPRRAVALLRMVRARAETQGWRAAVDSLRPVSQALWAGAPAAERARFLRHLRPWWDVHRHRLAPEIAARVAALEAQGRLRFAAGKLIEARPMEGGAGVRWRVRHGERIETLRVARIVNCTGPLGDLTQSRDPLLRRLIDAGAIRADAHRLGLDVDAQARVIDAAGHAQPGLFAVGPITRGAFWEVTAVPDIRRQVWDLARRLTNAHWVEGEGL